MIVLYTGRSCRNLSLRATALKHFLPLSPVRNAFHYNQRVLFYFIFKMLFVTHYIYFHNPLVGRDALFGKHCLRMFHSDFPTEVPRAAGERESFGGGVRGEG